MSAPMVLRQHGRSVLGCWPHPIVAAIGQRQPFRSGALRGELVNGDGLPASPGRLDGKSLDIWRDDRLRIDYVVWSYQTPIAWHAQGTWAVPEDHYSPTTTRHQGYARQAMQ